ncbi:MAG TPA: hypothetical protein DEF51_28035 [Myxococcales bacterium]|nr:hypothetical protein [Myxococcales bacterium]
MSPAIEVLHRDPTLVICARGPLMVANWWEAPSEAQMRLLQGLADARESRFPGGTAYAQFVLAGTPSFSPDVRKRAEELTTQHFSLGIAHVIEMGGLAGAAVRAFLGGLLLLTRGSKPMKVFAESAPAADWMARCLRMGGEPGWSTDDVLALRERAARERPASV